MENKASSEQVKIAVNQLKELEEHAVKNPKDYTDWQLDFLESHLDRIERFGDQTFFSIKQVNVIDQIHKEKVNGEKIDRPNKANRTRTKTRRFERKGE
ncbi:MAG: hypothetical protein KGI54_06570 [Pseudomonadota bacterium]|nr:hypothetical protein [Pseudomonadota bacterium]